MTEIFDSIALEVYNGSWVNLWPDVLHDPRPSWNRGIMSNKPGDRVGDPGILTFSLKNGTDNVAGLAGYYSPGHINCWSGWTTGLAVRLIFTFEGIPFYKYYGHIQPDGIDVDPGVYGKRAVSVSCGDWMWSLSQHELKTMLFAENKKIGDVVTLVNANMSPLAPLATSLSIGVETFPTVFDMVTTRTTALSEYAKAATSEWGYIYVKGDKTGGETLVAENQTDRANSALAALITLATTDVLVLKEDGDKVLKEDGDDFIVEQAIDTNVSTQLILSESASGFVLADDGFMLKEDGGKMYLDEVQYAVFDNLMLADMDIGYGRTQANRIVSKAYPRRVDPSGSPVVLYALQKPFQLDPLEVLTDYRGAYRDPDNLGSHVSGRDMAAPVEGVDYTASTDEAGTAGTAIVSDFAPNPVYGTEAVMYTPTNNNAGTALWVQTLQAKGRGVYTYDAIENVQDNTASQAIHGVHALTLDFKYQVDAKKAKTFAEYVLLKEAWPHITIDACPIWANSDSMRMYGFLQLEPGTRATFIEMQSGINAAYFIMSYNAEIFDSDYVLWTPILNKDPGYYATNEL